MMASPSLLSYNEIQLELHIRSAPAFQTSLGSQRTDQFAAKQNPVCTSTSMPQSSS